MINTETGKIGYTGILAEVLQNIERHTKLNGFANMSLGPLPWAWFLIGPKVPRSTVFTYLDYWTKTLDWNTGLDYWTDIFLIFTHVNLLIDF